MKTDKKESFGEDVKCTLDINKVIARAVHDSPDGKDVAIVVEDSEGEIRPIVYAWYDATRDMVRLSLEDTRFQDYDEADTSTSDDIVDYERDGYGFRNFFNAGLDKMTGICDGEGVDVFIKGASGSWHFIQNVYGYMIADVFNMTDAEFQNWLDEYGIF